MSEEYESVTGEELQEFIKNYPRKLTEHTVNFHTPPITTYIDFEMGDAIDGIVAKEYWGTDEEDDLWYMPENERYYILRNYEEVLRKRKWIREKKQQIYANAVLKDGKLIFWWTGGECTELYDFFKDFWSAGLNFAMDFVYILREKEFENWNFMVFPQAEVEYKSKTYRVDFMVSMEKYEDKIQDVIQKDIVVECDGHEFHQKTKEQVKHDNEREMQIKLAGYDVLRFSGSQIYEDPIKCANDIIDYALTKISR